MKEREYNSCFLCDKRSITELKIKAEKEAAEILKELSVFYSGNFSIKITVNTHLMGFGVAATLFLDDKAIKTEDPADLLFLDLNNLMLQKMINLLREKNNV